LCEELSEYNTKLVFRGASLDRKYDYTPELGRVARDLSGILKDNFVGFYIIGSFMMGDWDPERSDIDFIAITGSL
jgi:hypothetical protein